MNPKNCMLCLLNNEEEEAKFFGFMFQDTVVKHASETAQVMWHQVPVYTETTIA